MKRSGKFYRKNESEVMERLGFVPTFNSGSGWIQKEDGENDFALCQLKSTDSNSIKINKIDIEKLLHNSYVSHKLPVFAIQFLPDNGLYLLVRPEDLKELAECIDTGREPKNFFGIDIDEKEEYNNVSQKKIVSSENARLKYFEKKKEKYEKKGRRAN